MMWQRACSCGRIRRNGDNDREMNKKPGCDCRGSSLIEVIVAMLILAIIIVPMLDMFANATRINGKARGRQYANAVLENVLEELRAENYTFVYGVADAKAEELRDIGRQLRLYTQVPNDKILSGKSFLTGVIQQGTKEYQAQISFSADDYRGGDGLNDYAMPDINSYDSGNSEMLLLDADGDRIIVEEFYRQYLVQEQEEYQQRLNRAWMESEEYLFRYEFEKWYEEWQKTHDEEPPEDYEPPAFNESSVRSSNPLTLEEFGAFIRKRTEIKIEGNSVDDYGVRYVVSYFVQASTDALRLEQSFQESYQYESGSGSRFAADKLNFIYIFYQPFTERRDQEELVIDAREISLASEWKCKVYLAVQGGVTGEALPVTVNMDNSLGSDERYARLEILTAGGIDTNHNNFKTELVPERTPEDTVYRVTVKIFEVETGEMIAEAETTVYHE